MGVIRDLKDQISEAEMVYGGMTSTHEGLGVLIEEVHELQQAIHQNDAEAVRLEALQVAAVALRIIYSLDNPDCYRRSGLM